MSYMAKHERRPLPAPALATRPGEGAVIDIVLDQFVAPDGTQVANIGLNLGAAPVPDRKYVADACAVTSALGTVKLMFGQERVGGKSWRSLVLVQMTVESASRFLGTLQQPGGALGVANPIASKYGPESLTTDVVEPDGQAITLGANLAVVGISENEACLDFYQASPFSLGFAIQSKKLALDPVVRIDLRASLFFALVEGLRSVGIQPQELKVKGEVS
jgi:hypothetical protein